MCEFEKSFESMTIRGSAWKMEHTKLSLVMMEGSCMSITPQIPTPGYGCVVLMMEGALEPSMLAVNQMTVIQPPPPPQLKILIMDPAQ